MCVHHSLFINFEIKWKCLVTFIELIGDDSFKKVKKRIDQLKELNNYLRFWKYINNKVSTHLGDNFHSRSNFLIE